MERSLDAMGERAVDILESMSDGFVGLDREWRYTYVNRTAERIARLPREEMLGRTIRDVFPEHAPRFERACQPAMYEGMTVRFEEHYSALDAWLEDIVYPSADGVSVCVQDITERKRIQNALRASEERLRLVIESAEDYAIFTLDLDGRVTSWNTGAERAFGYDESEIVGRPGEILFTPEDRELGVPADEMKRTRETGRASEERYYLKKGGARFFASGVMRILRDHGAHGYGKIARDLTERRQADQALERSVSDRAAALMDVNALLQEEVRQRVRIEEERGQLLRRIVLTQEEERRRISREMHDQFGQQLSALTLQLAALKGGHGSEPGLREQLAAVEATVQRLDADVDFLVWEMRPTALDDLGLPAALTEYVASWSKHFGTAARLHVSGMANRPTHEIETTLYRVTQEALNNVAKHARARHVDVLLEHRPDHTSLIVEDDGVGFDTDEAAAAGGKRLGLIGMRERTALVGGTLDIESRLGKGTTVVVRIPAPRIREGGSA